GAAPRLAAQARAEQGVRGRIRGGRAARRPCVRRGRVDPDVDALRLGGQRTRHEQCRDLAPQPREAPASRQDDLRGGGATVSSALRMPNPSSMYRWAFGSVTQRSPSTRNMYLWRPTGTGNTADQTPSPSASRSSWPDGSQPWKSPAIATERAPAPANTNWTKTTAGSASAAAAGAAPAAGSPAGTGRPSGQTASSRAAAAAPASSRPAGRTW